MLFCLVTFVTLLVLIQNLYAAPIGESVGTSNPNENYLSNTFSTGTAAAIISDEDYFESYLIRTANQASVLKKHCNSLNSTVDTPHSSSKSSFKCRWENCNQSFENLTELSKHIQSHIVKRQKYYKCKWENCNYGCYKISDLQKHLRKHTKERPFVCQCGKSFDRNENLKKHIETIHSSKVQKITHLVQECESLELDKNEVQQQALLHCDWKNCNREFNDVTLLSEHIEKYHIGGGQSCYECQWMDCSYATRCKTNIQNHIRKHSKERPFICSFNDCGKSYSQKCHLNEHMNVHVFNSCFLCPLLDCDKNYSSINTIRGHFHVHAAASNLSISDVDSIWNAFRNNFPYPVEISNRIKLKERIIQKQSKIASIENESNQKQAEGNETSSEISATETEGNIYNLESNEIYISDPDLDLILSDVTTFDEESVTNDKILTDRSKGNTDAANHLTECISFTELDKDITGLKFITKRPLDCVNNFDYASKRIKSIRLTENSMDCDVAYRREQNDHQNLQSPLPPLSLKTKLEQLLHSISNELDAEYFIEKYLETQ